MAAPDPQRQRLTVATLAPGADAPARDVAIRFGLPLPRGQWFAARSLGLFTEAGRPIACVCRALALWPDNSLQWVLFDARIDIAATTPQPIHLGAAADTGVQVHPGPVLREDDESLRLHGRHGELRIDTQTLRFQAFGDDGLQGQVEIVCAGATQVPVIDHYRYENLTCAAGAVATRVHLESAVVIPQRNTPLHVSCDLTITRDGAGIEGRVTLHNPAAATHAQGLWDLGDPASLVLDRVSLRLTGGMGRLQALALAPEPDQAALQAREHLRITQHASGGAHWDSPVHVDATGEMPLRHPGYVLDIDGETSRGARAEPTLHLTVGEQRLSARLEAFWERFPSGIEADSEGVILHIVPGDAAPQELQPGERLTRRFRLCLEDGAGEPILRLCPDYVASCALPLLGDPAQIDARIGSLLDEGLDAQRGFVAKREAIDEYGWRHYGDLYADHETDGYTGQRPFVSHYNNQYDPLGGFLRQYLRTGENRWRALGDALAAHTVDIDIYHTQDDRPEYNHGLFWHTDHYLPAETSTHRSYSRRQPRNAYEGHARGGGPGGQHCYTQGLLLHYLLTGEERSREALYELRAWIERVYEGSGRLADVALAVKNQRRVDLKNHLTGRYPLDRGVANYLQALLDTHVLDRSPATLRQVEAIIAGTVHPRDDLGARDLGNVEEHWFYVVFLQALCRYLRVKIDAETVDSAFIYARDCLLHYATWMLEHEAPYLDKPDILEFPNDTWAAQDLRKANVLFEAAYWAPEGNAAFAARGQEFVDYVATTLAASDTRHYTRILSLLMQNASPSRALAGPTPSRPPRGLYTAPAQPGRLRQSARLLAMAMRALRNLQPREEVVALRRILGNRRGEPGE